MTEYRYKNANHIDGRNVEVGNCGSQVQQSGLVASVERLRYDLQQMKIITQSRELDLEQSSDRLHRFVSVQEIHDELRFILFH